MSLWHKKFAEMLNVVVIVKTHLQTHKIAHVVLFSSDLTLGYDLLIDYYRLRFQLEFNFRRNNTGDSKNHECQRTASL